MNFQYKGKNLELILLTYTGSRLYGTQYELGENPFDKEYVSDYDWKGIFIESIEDKKSLLSIQLEQIECKEENLENEDEYTLNEKNKVKKILEKIINNNNLPFDNKKDDIFLYEIEKFINLAAIKNNPDILTILFTPKEKILYINKLGKELIRNKEQFLSIKVKDTFENYAKEQLYRINTHHKYFKDYPLIYEVENIIKKALLNKDINYKWIENNFSIHIVNYFKNIKINEEKNIKNLSFDEFINKYKTEKLNEIEILKYKKPLLIDFVYPKKLNGQKINWNEIYNNTKITKDLLINECVFRNISNTQYNLFLPVENQKKGKGILNLDGSLKVNPAKEIGDFLCQLTIDQLSYKKVNDKIQKLWDWKVHRNEKRSVLEEHFGYDTKHGLHLFRLLLKAKILLETGKYNPVLSKEELKEVLEIRDGKLTYEQLIEKVNKKEIEINNVKSILPEKVDLKKIDILLKKLLFNKKIDKNIILKNKEI